MVLRLDSTGFSVLVGEIVLVGSTSMGMLSCVLIQFALVVVFVVSGTAGDDMLCCTLLCLYVYAMYVTFGRAW